MQYTTTPQRIFSFLLFTPSIAYGMVNLHDAGYSDVYSDLELGSNANAPKLERLYNSRSRFVGLMGYGWCLGNELEARLQISGDGLSLYDCKLNEHLTFERRGRDSSEWVGTHNRRDRIRLITRQGSTGFAYERRQPDGRVQVFDHERGRLLSTRDRRGQPIHLRYDESDRLQEIRIDRDWTKLFYDSPTSRLISRLQTSSGTFAFYDHAGDDLITARAPNRDFRYSYDTLHNLKEARENGAIRVEISYDADHDRVTGLRDRKGCLAQFTYDASRDHASTHVLKSCGEHTPLALRYDFWYRHQPGANRAVAELARVEVAHESTPAVPR